jgi:DNA topoisomerase-1
MSKLVIVESPAKAKTIEKYLGPDYKVMATFGHVRDLPTKNIGIEIEKDFEPKYIVPAKSKKTVANLKKAADGSDQILLATDPDREGEAISWHVAHALKLKSCCKRIEFNEITKEAVTRAVQNPREINGDLVDAQQARRVLDRLVGYTLSPLLWRKIKRGLSAGRVQSVAVKLIVDREREIEAFKPEEYWEILASLQKRETKEGFEAKLTRHKGETLAVSNKAESDKVLNDLEGAKYIVDKVEQKEVKKRPAAPFITSTLQQEAARKLYFSAKKTMMLAQQLYEGIDTKEGTIGLITYMRTDSTTLANEFLTQIRHYISESLGKENLPDSPRTFKKAKQAQEAHEAIRPTSIYRKPEDLKKYLTGDQYRLYELIWKRTLASQMSDCIYIQTGVDIKANDYIFRAGGRVIKFPGFMNVYIEGDPEEEEQKKMPELTEGEDCILDKIIPTQKFTEPPARYNEASLIKELEANGIGRPSTYAPIISTIQDRGYVNLESRRFYPTEIGFVVTDMLAEHFPFVVSVDFTAHVEDELDEIASGKEGWRKVVGEFWYPFAGDLEKAQGEIQKVKMEKPTDEICDVCGKPMVIKQGRYGEFLACTGFPECKNTKPLAPKTTGMKCPKCMEGDIVERRTKRGKVFWGCSRFPKCDFASWTKPEEKKESKS